MFNLIYSEDYQFQSVVEEFIEHLRNLEPISLQTSGSTGIPKQLLYPASILKSSARKTNEHFNLNEYSRAVLCMSPETIAGKMMIVRAIEGNYSLELVNPSKRPLEKININLDFIAMVPLQLKESILHDLSKLSNIPNILIGGGAISKDLETLLHEKKLTVTHSFGMTETVSHVALRKVGENTDPYFNALPGIQFSETEGQLVIHAPDLGIRELLTNDLVELQSKTSFRWLGRKDFVINSGGYKILPEQLEHQWSDLLDCPFFLWKESDNKWGEILVMYFESKKWPKINGELLADIFKSHELPKNYYLCDTFTYTSSGKIDRSKSAANISKESREKAF